MVRHTLASRSGAALASALAITLVGCGRTSTTPDAATRPTASSFSTAVPSPSATVAARLPTPFGQSVTYQNHVTITVSKARRIHLVGYMETRSKHMGYVRFTVTVSNGSPSRLYLSRYVARIRSGTSAGHAVYDPTMGLNAPPEAPLAARQTQSFDLAFGVDDTTRLVLDLDLRDGLEPNRWARSLA